MIHSLEYHRVDLFGLVILIGDFHFNEGISKSLNTNTDWSMPHVRVLGLWNWVIVHINDSVQILGHASCHLVELLIVESSISVDKHW